MTSTPPSPPFLSFILRISSFLLLFLLPSCNRTPPAASDPESAANTFFATLETGNPHAAYDSAAFGFQAAQTFDGFLSNARELGLIGGKPPTWTRKDLHNTEARIEGSLISQSGKPLAITVTMTPDGNAWKLFALKTASGSQEAENRFTLVGKGAGLNDVYHQPMPDARQLADLIHKTAAGFSAAVLQGDFHTFYLSLSQQWRDGQRLSGAEASGVTEKMLKDHFQGFIDKKIDLSAVAALPPVYDTPPLIDEDGLLVLRGHFNTQPYRLNFDLQYVYELPWWKLFGINMSLTQ